jgi:predicted DNA-binding transcriptional regulator YafY
LEVTARTVYRDVATLQARQVPIEGAPGLGYALRRGFDLPPLMFTIEEVETIAVGARMLRRTGDAGLQEATGPPAARRRCQARPPRRRWSDRRRRRRGDRRRCRRLTGATTKLQAVNLGPPPWTKS